MGLCITQKQLDEKLEELLREGAKAERARIVAWLRAPVVLRRDEVLDRLADTIEQGKAGE